MVRGLIPSWAAASLLEAPVTSWANTSPSRFVNGLQPANSVGSPLTTLLLGRLLHATIASCTAVETVFARNGFSMKSSAPCLIASTAIGMSPVPEIMRMGTAYSSAFRSLRISSPDRPGRCTSSRMQDGSRARAAARNDSPSAKPATSYPFRRRMADRVSRTARSSSTTKISPLDEPSSDIFRSHIVPNLDRLATMIPSRRQWRRAQGFLRYGSSLKGDRVRHGLRNRCFSGGYILTANCRNKKKSHLRDLATYRRSAMLCDFTYVVSRIFPGFLMY